MKDKCPTLIFIYLFICICAVTTTLCQRPSVNSIKVSSGWTLDVTCPHYILMQINYKSCLALHQLTQKFWAKLTAGIRTPSISAERLQMSNWKVTFKKKRRLENHCLGIIKAPDCNLCIHWSTSTLHCCTTAVHTAVYCPFKTPSLATPMDCETYSSLVLGGCLTRCVSIKFMYLKCWHQRATEVKD